MDILSRLTALARRLTRHPLLIVLVALGLSVVSVMLVGRLRFDTDLADLLPKDHPDLVELRRIQKKQPSDTGFMVLLSRHFLFATDEQGQALVYDGMRWQPTPTGAPLYAVWGFSVTEVYAAGAKGRVHRWDGKRWRPQPSGSDATLYGLWGRSADALYAVGSGGTVLRRGADGKWPRQPTPGASATLRAVSGNAAGLAYAVGDGGVVLRKAASAERWQRVAVPSKRALRGVWVAADGQVFIVGDGGTMLRFDGKRWRALASGTRADLHAVWGERPDAVFAVGDRGTALRYDGKRVVREVFRIHDNMRALHGLRHDRLWAVGQHCSLERRTIAVRRERHGEYMMVHWWDGPQDSPRPRKSAWPPKVFAGGSKRCTRAYTAVWRPPNKMKATIAFLPKLAAELRRGKLVGRVEYRKPVQFFINRAFYFASVSDLHKIYDHLKRRLDRETAKATGLFVDIDDDDNKSADKKDRDELKALVRKYRDSAAARSEYYLEYDGASVGILVFPRRGGSDIAGLRRLREELSRIIDKSGYHSVDPLLRIDIGGDGVAKIAEYEATIGDITGLAWLAVAGIVLVLVLYMRRVLGLLFVLVPLALSLTWTFGLTALTIGTLNSVTGFLFAVIFGVGIDYGIQLYGRYREVRSAGGSIDEALDHMILGTGRATMTSALTSAAALLTLLITDFRGFSEFGFISGIGVVFALVSFLCVQPALLIGAERIGLLRLDKGRAVGTRPKPLRLPRVVLAVSALALVFGVYGTTQLRFEYNNRVLRPIGHRSEILHRSDHCFGQSFTPTVLAAGSRARLRAALDALERTRRRLGKRSAVRRTSSILSAVPHRQPEKRVLIARISKLLHSKRWRLVSDKTKRRIHLAKLRTMSDAKPFSLRDLPASVRRTFHGPGYGDSWLGMVYYGINISDTRQARRLKKQVGGFEGSPMVSVKRLLPSAKVFVDGQRVEVGCGDGAAASVAACRAKLTGLSYGGKPVFARVLSDAQAVADKLAVKGGLRGQLLAIARPGLVPVAATLAAPVTPSGRFSASSGELIIAEVVDVMLHDGKIAFGVALLVVFLACWVDFRSLKLAALSCVPLGLGIIWTFGLMHALGIKLNMFNFVVLPALVGIGIDYGVHFIHRCEESGESLAIVRGALYWVLFFCACTTVVGFGNMALADHPGLRSLGQLAIIGLVCIFLASTYTLPGLLGLRRRGKDGERPVDAPGKRDADEPHEQP